MPSPFAPDPGQWWELLLALGVGTAVIVAVAAAADRWFRQAVWQRALWRATTLGLFALVLLEVTGVGSAVVQLCRRQSSRHTPCAVRPAEPYSADGTRSVPATLACQGGPPPDRSCLGDLPPQPVTGSELLAPAEPAVETELPAPGTWWPAAVWATGTAVVLAWMVWARVLLMAFRRGCRPGCDEATRMQVDRLAERLGIRRQIRVLTSQRLHSPVVFGSFRPVLVLPRGFSRAFDTRQQEAVLAHELGHLAARDPFWLTIATVLAGLVWWHPLAWWSRRRLRAASEAAADEASLVVPDGPCVLAESLVLLGRRLLRPRALAWLSVEGTLRSGLGRRVERLLNLGGQPWRAPRRGRLAIAHATLPVVFCLLAILGTAWATSQVPLTQGETTMGVLKSSWRCSLAATALCAILASDSGQASAEPQPGERQPAERQAAERPRAERQPAERQPSERPRAERQPAERQPAAAQNSPERDKLREQMQAMKAKVEQLEKEGKHEEAEKVKREAHEILSKLYPQGAERGQASPEREKVREQLQAMKQKVEQLEKEGKHEEAEKVKREAHELMGRMNPHGREGGPAGPESEKLRERLQAMKQKIEQLEKEGKHEEAAAVKREAQAMMGRMSRGGEGAPAGGSRQGPGDMSARIQHMRMAAENLKAAGLEPEAQHVMQMIEHIQRGGGEGRPHAEGRAREEGRPHPEGQTRGEGRSRGEGQPMPGRSPRGEGGSPHEVQELQNQIQKMHHEMEELREQLKRSGDRPQQR